MSISTESAALVTLHSNWPPQIFENYPNEDRISDLPDELILNIFSYLGGYDLGRMGMVSKKFQNITNTPSLWKGLLHFPLSRNYKSEYVSCLKKLKDRAVFYTSMTAELIGIKDQLAIIETLKYSAPKKGFKIDPKALKELTICDQKLRNYFIERTIEENKDFLLCSLEEYDIQDQDLLFNLAMIEINRNPEWTVDIMSLCHQFKKFHILDEDKRIEIARAIVKKDPMSISSQIQEFSIHNQEVLEELMTAAVDSPWGGAISNLYMDIYGIEDPAARNRIKEAYKRSRHFKPSEPSQVAVN